MSTEQTSLLPLFDRPRREAQAARVLAELKKGRALTKWEIIHELRALNAGGRIFDLRHGIYDGVNYPIEMEKIEIKTVDGVAKVARYKLNAETNPSLSHGPEVAPRSAVAESGLL